MTSTRAALFPAAGTPPRIVELELAPPGPGEVLVRLHSSGICRHDLDAADGSVPWRFPIVLGHEGAGVVEEVGSAVEGLSPGDHVALSWTPSCGQCDECRRGLPHLCSTVWPRMLAGGLLDGTSRMSFGGADVHHYCFLSTFAERAVVPQASCVRVPDDVPMEVACLLGCAVTSGVGAVWNTAGVERGDRVAVFGLRGAGLAAVLAAAHTGAEPIVAVDNDPERLARALESGATDAVRWAGTPESVAERVVATSGGGVDYAFEDTGRPGEMLAAFLSTRARGAAVLMGVPRSDISVTLPALTIPRMERRVLGSIYGSSQPDRDFLRILDQYRDGRLPIDRLVSSRAPLDAVGDVMNRYRFGGDSRVVLELGVGA
jgi:S-(hydroxymethyl)glutathione dehydrogenase / alcohol dehydrogenase